MIVFAVAVCYFLISFIVMQSDIKSQEKYNAQLRTQLADKKAENEELEKLVKSSDLDDYVEQIARRELGYVSRMKGYITTNSSRRTSKKGSSVLLCRSSREVLLRVR